MFRNIDEMVNEMKHVGMDLPVLTKQIRNAIDMEVGEVGNDIWGNYLDRSQIICTIQYIYYEYIQKVFL